jgi:hypothetical protein
MLRGILTELGEVAAQGGYCYAASLPKSVPAGDDLSDPCRSTLRLFEDEREIGPAHAEHEVIRTLGGGRFSHWGTTLYFSASDGSDPRSNRRTYRFLWSAIDDSGCARVLRQAWETWNDDLDYESRYALAERVFAAMVPGEHLSECNRTMFHDAAFRADYERFETANYRSFDRKFALRSFARSAAMLPGDFAECGVFKGASAYILAKAICKNAPEKCLHLFDSFSGLSQPGLFDGSYWRVGALAAATDEVERNLADVRHVIRIYPGWIPARFHEVAERSFALVHVDVDLYEPTRACLEFFAPRLVPGGMLICDDYGFKTCPGAKRAVDDFAASGSWPVVHLPTGQAVLYASRR